MTGQPRRRHRIPQRWTLLIVLGVPALVLLGLALGYYRYVHFNRVAAVHVPPGCDVAVRVDLEQVVLFEPFRKHVIAALNEATRAAELSPLSQRIEAVTGINVALDLREIVYATGHENQWLVVLGGLFKGRHLLADVVSVLGEDKALSVRLSSDQLLATVEPWSMSIAQATDGAFLVASSESLLRSALPASEAFLSLGLKREGPGSLGAIAPWDEALRASLAPVARLAVEFSLGPTIDLLATVELDQPTAASSSAKAWLDEAKLHAAGLGDTWAPLRAALTRAHVVDTEANRWVFQGFFERREVDTFAQDLAARLLRRLDQH